MEHFYILSVARPLVLNFWASSFEQIGFVVMIYRKRISGFLSVLLVFLGGMQSFQVSATTYNVSAIFVDAIYPTQFDGSFDWDGLAVSNFHGKMNSSMWEIDDINPNFNTSYPLLRLDYQLAQSMDGDLVTMSVFKENTTDVFTGGGYTTGDTDFYGMGYYDENGQAVLDQIRNDNAYFTMTFDKITMNGVVDSLVYGDCTPGGMMGITCMTGHVDRGTMQAYPFFVEISAVPVPAAVWLFGSALLGMVGVSRKRTLSV